MHEIKFLWSAQNVSKKVNKTPIILQYTLAAMQKNASRDSGRFQLW